jgi:hypothetical protein
MTGRTLTVAANVHAFVMVSPAKVHAVPRMFVVHPMTVNGGALVLRGVLVLYPGVGTFGTLAPLQWAVRVVLGTAALGALAR